MRCEDCQALVHQRLDGDRVIDPAVERHLAECAECRSWHAAAARLQEGLRLLPPSLPPSGLSRRVVARVLAERRRQRRRVHRIPAFFAAAAALLLAVYLGYRLSPREHQVTRSNPPRQVQTPSTQVPLEENAVEAGSALVSLLGRTADEAMSQGRSVLPSRVAVPSLPETTSWRMPLQRPVASLRDAGEGLSAGLEPVTTSARRAVNLLWSEIPGNGATPPRKG